MKPSFQASEDARKCAEFLERRDSATYREISQHLGRRVNGPDRYVLETARRILERRGIIFVVNRGHGLTRATNGQVAELATAVPITKVQRVVRKAKKRQRIPNVQRLTADERLAFYVGRAALQAIEQNASKKTRNKIAKAIEANGGEPVALRKTIELFKNGRAH